MLLRPAADRTHHSGSPSEGYAQSSPCLNLVRRPLSYVQPARVKGNGDDYPVRLLNRRALASLQKEHRAMSDAKFHDRLAARIAFPTAQPWFQINDASSRRQP